MISFGAKIKQLREEKGMTQQSLAEKLYVTRQAVSRWECGARYPDLLTAKKIAQVLDVSVDELLSGEELKENIEKEPIVEKGTENLIQIIAYMVAVVIYLVRSILVWDALMEWLKGIFIENSSYRSHPVYLILSGQNMLIFAAALAGLFLSARHRLGAKTTGCIMMLPYLMEAAFRSTFLVSYIQMQNYKMDMNPQETIYRMIYNIFIPLLFAIFILLFFMTEKLRLMYGGIIIICVYQIVNSAVGIALGIRPLSTLVYKNYGTWYFMMLHYLGDAVMIFLLGYQAFIWNKKKKVAYKK